MDMFTIYKLRQGADAGRHSLSIGIIVDGVVEASCDQLNIVFGEPYMAPGMPMNIMAAATSDTDDHRVPGSPPPPTAAATSRATWCKAHT